MDSYSMQESEAYGVPEREQTLDLEQTIEQLDVAYRKFTKACDQLLVIDDRTKMVEVRYKRAKENQTEAHRYSLRLQLSTLSNMKMMFYYYAQEMAEVVQELKTKVQQMEVQYSDVESEYSFSEDEEDEDMDE